MCVRRQVKKQHLARILRLLYFGIMCFRKFVAGEFRDHVQRPPSGPDSITGNGINEVFRGLQVGASWNSSGGEKALQKVEPGIF